MRRVVPLDYTLTLILSRELHTGGGLGSLGLSASVLTGRAVRGPCQGRSMRRDCRAIPHCPPDLSLGKADKHPSSLDRIWVRTVIEAVSGGPLRAFRGQSRSVTRYSKSNLDSK